MNIGQSIPLRFTGASELIDASRVGADLTFSAAVSDFHPPSMVQETTRQYSRLKSRKATTNHGQYARGSMVFSPLPVERLILLDEFLESVRGEDEFVIDARHISGVRREITAFITDSEHNRIRLANHREYDFSFDYEALLDPGTVASEGAFLTRGLTNSTPQAGTVANPRRFAFYYFDVSDVNDALRFSYQATGNGLRITLNGRRIASHQSGTASQQTLLDPRALMLGTNSIQVEALNFAQSWSITNARISDA